jgi:hypothetical protein
VLRHVGDVRHTTKEAYNRVVEHVVLIAQKARSTALRPMPCNCDWTRPLRIYAGRCPRSTTIAPRSTPTQIYNRYGPNPGTAMAAASPQPGPRSLRRSVHHRAGTESPSLLTSRHLLCAVIHPHRSASAFPVERLLGGVCVRP